jgi:soluble lytic murein transglycosylase-like protein
MRLMKSDVRAKRAVALAQIGRASEAGLELRAGLASARSDAQRKLWTTLALELNPSQGSARKPRGFDPDDYPTPRLTPTGGFTLDKALVYAIVRQESRFDPNAVSGAGAIGLMQLMPQSAAEAAGDDKLLADSSPLYDPSTNLRVGQDYVSWLMDKATNGDLIRAVAAYNGGPGTLLRTQQSTGDADPLMLIESLPAAETRDYVEKVIAAYWVYRRIFGESARSIDAIASGASAMPARMDR